MGQNNDTKHINEVMNKDVAIPSKIASSQDAVSELDLKNTMAYIEADAFTGNPYSLLGRVIEVRKQDGKIPTGVDDTNFKPEFSIFPIMGAKLDPESKIKKPVKRRSILVNKSLSTKVSFLNFLSAELDASSVFSLMVFDQATGLVDTSSPEFRAGVQQWKTDNQDLIADPEIAYLYVVIGMVQKNILRKKYQKFNAGAKGGAYGVNVEGALHTSTEDYSLDIRFGLLPAILKRPKPAEIRGFESKSIEELIDVELNEKELSLFAAMNRVSLKE